MTAITEQTDALIFQYPFVARDDGTPISNTQSVRMHQDYKSLSADLAILQLMDFIDR